MIKMEEENIVDEVETLEDVKTTSKDSKVKQKKNKSEAELESVNLELSEIREEFNKLNEKYLRVIAEMQNIKRRNDDEISRIRKYESEDLIVKLLDITDDFERALLVNVDVSTELQKFLDGFGMIFAALKSIIQTKGVEEIICLNEVYNAEIAQAVLTEKHDDIEPNIIIDVLQKGYRYNGKVIRPAMVKVSE